ncbi:MAG: hypothetical protein M1814_002059 [Vezdaea aestivalis]|nr:MAG: hypothetical protein M1814_002059 [Vezdaea aestivalis]
MSPPAQRHSDEIELLSRPRSDSQSSSRDSRELDELFRPQSSSPTQIAGRGGKLSLTGFLRSLFNRQSRQKAANAYSHYARVRGRTRLLRQCRLVLFCTGGIIILLILFVGIFNPSYTHLPPHYQALSKTASTSGRANLRNEKVFVAANIIDAKLIDGAWSAAVLGLIDILGEDNVFLSVFENDSGQVTTEALRRFETKVKCNSSIISEHMPIEQVPTVTLPSGRKRVKRIAYLAEVRNRALRPLDYKLSRSFNVHLLAGSEFDKVLFINDVVFSPVDAAQLLFSTNVDKDGKTQYRAACAIDFINPFKFYDTFATRDLEGFGMGVPFFPWFSGAGHAFSRRDVLAGTDAVRVRSCWGGMVAFEARWLQADLSREASEKLGARNVNSLDGADDIVRDLDPNARSGPPVRFRAENDTFWDASECCLIHADIQKQKETHDGPEDVGIFLNPYIRVAYSERTHGWLQFTRRFERLYSVPHSIVNRLAGLPFFNPRRLEGYGQHVEDKVWVYDDPNWQDHADEGNGLSAGRSGQLVNGSFQIVQRIAGKGGFCGSRMLLVLRDEPTAKGKKWEKLPIPPGR